MIVNKFVIKFKLRFIKNYVNEHFKNQKFELKTFGKFTTD